MSGTTQSPGSGSLTIASGSAGVYPVGYGYYPPEGSRIVTAQYGWTVTGYVDDLSQIVARGVETSIQGAYVDNSQNDQAVTMTVQSSGQVVTCPAFAQGCFPLFFSGNPSLQLTVPSATGFVTRVSYLNMPPPVGVWFPATGSSATADGMVLATNTNAGYAAGTTQPVTLSPGGGLNIMIVSPAGAQISTSAGVMTAGASRQPPTVVSGGTINTLTLDSFAALYVNTETSSPMYIASSFFNIPVNATDCFTLYGSATKTVRVHEVWLASNQPNSLQLVKRAAVNTGGTSAALNMVPLDSSSANATASALAYSVNPVGLGATVGQLMVLPYTVADGLISMGKYGATDQSVVLRGVAEGIAVGISGGVGVAASLAVSVKWQEV